MALKYLQSSKKYLLAPGVVQPGQRAAPRPPRHLLLPDEQGRELHQRAGGGRAAARGQVVIYRVSHIIGPTFFLPFFRVLEHIQRNFS